MRVAGRERVISALLDAPRISIGGLISCLPIIIKRQNEESAFRIYVADALQAIAQNTSGLTAKGLYLKERFFDIINPAPEETRTPEEIINQMTEKLRKIGGE